MPFSPNSIVLLINRPTYLIKNPFSALHEKLKPKPLKPSVDHIPVEDLEADKVVEIQSSGEIIEGDASEAESREGRYIQFGTPVVQSPEEINIDEAPKDAGGNSETEGDEGSSVEDKDSRIIQKVLGRQSTVWETKTIYATKTEKVNDHVTATLVLDNCVPVDPSVPKCKVESHHAHAPAPLLADNYGQSYEHHFDEVRAISITLKKITIFQVFSLG